MPLAPVKKCTRLQEMVCIAGKQAGAQLGAAPHPSAHPPRLCPGLGTQQPCKLRILHFHQDPTASLFKLVPDNLPEGSETQQILRGAAPRSSSSLAVAAEGSSDAGAAEQEMGVCCLNLCCALCKQIQSSSSSNCFTNHINLWESPLFPGVGE